MFNMTFCILRVEYLNVTFDFLPTEHNVNLDLPHASLMMLTSFAVY